MNALDSAAVVDVCYCFSIVQSFSNRLFVLRLLSSSDSQPLLNFWYSGSTVTRICQCSNSISMSFYQEQVLNLSGVHGNAYFWIALELEELCHQQIQSLNTALLIHTDELVPNVLGITLRQYKICKQLTVHLRLTPPSGRYPAPTATNILYTIFLSFV